MPRRNVTWTRDELILALEFYMRHRASGAMPRQNSQEIKFLSETLNKLAVLHDFPRGENFRNENGVYLKLMNFHHIDPTSGILAAAEDQAPLPLKPRTKAFTQRTQSALSAER